MTKRRLVSDMFWLVLLLNVVIVAAVMGLVVWTARFMRML